MTTTDGRHERHMMRQRGAGARPIPTNFGFIFQAGPIQLSATTPAESPPPTNASLPVAFPAEVQKGPKLSPPAEKAGPKRKRVVREDEEEDQVWFSKRSKKSTTAQKDESHIISTVSEEVLLDKTQMQPPTETKPTKRKVVRKRILVPKSRQKAPAEPEPKAKPQPRPDQLPVAPEPTPEDVAKFKRKTRAKAPVVSKNKPNRVDIPIEPLQDDGREDEPSNHPLHDVPTTESAPSRKTKSNEETSEGTAEPKKRTKAVVRKRVVRKDIQKDTANERPNLKEDTKTTEPIVLLKKEMAEEIPKAKITKKRKVIKKHVDESVEQEVISDTRAILTNPMEGLPPTLEMTESVQAEKKRKIVKRVRVPRATKTKVLPEKDDQTTDAAAQNESKPSRSRPKLILEAETSDPFPKRPETSLAQEESRDKKSNTRERKTKVPKAKKEETTKEVVSEDTTPKPIQPKSLHHSKPAVSEAEDADLALFESEAQVPVTKKATKAPKRVFNDDSEIDLDHMLSGIAAMAGTGAAKPSVTKSTRVAKKRAAIS
ncbi:hypothetical protein D6C90_09803 [Aureobasidium pullulans]|uniref:Uncharacterized protein n=1 Tax=Aureobasidium pullulans TaxID=5580 RepID=A0A4S9T3T7_AURPU|nr:hypothetical protein D6C90_09803 [Aureobasidium pullulans]